MPWSRTSSEKPASDERLFDDGLLWALKGLALPRRKVQGAVPGAHAGGRPGRGEDFFQHRAYVTGEDVRTVDFRASARSGHLLVKELHRPLRQPLVVLVDQSASMRLFGKRRTARQVGAALAVLALRRGDPVAVLGIDGSRLVLEARLLGAAHPTRVAEQVFAALPDIEAAQLFPALHGSFPLELGGTHLVVVSDLYGDIEEAHAAFARLGSRAAALTVIQVLAAEELALPAGLEALRDVETGDEIALGVDAAAEYARRVAAWREALQQMVEGQRGEWRPLEVAEPVGLMLRRWLG